MIAALYVETDGCYFGSPDVDAWDITRDARLYAGPHPVVAHPPCQHWSDWAAGLRLEYSARLRPERATDASGSSSWPTATALNRPRSPETMEKCAAFRKRNANQNTVPLYLEEVAIQWATPCARDHFPAHTPEYIASKKAQGHGMRNLNDEAAHWPTPLTADDGRKVTARSAQTQLCNIAEAWPDQHSRPDLPTVAGGRSSTDRRRLNPLFVEWLMGWPEGLSGFDTVGTASCHSPQPSPGCGCMDCWLSSQRAMLSDLLTITPPAQGTLF